MMVDLVASGGARHVGLPLKSPMIVCAADVPKPAHLAPDHLAQAAEAAEEVGTFRAHRTRRKYLSA